jgi:hypothetical protein
MLDDALVFLVGVIAGAPNLAGGSTVAVQMSWILVLIGSALVTIHAFKGAHRPGCVTGGRAVRRIPA